MTAAAAATAFLSGAAFDVLNVRFLKTQHAGEAHAAARYSTLLGACSLTGWLEAVSDHWAIPFLLAGYYVGTYLAVRYNR